MQRSNMGCMTGVVMAVVLVAGTAHADGQTVIEFDTKTQTLSSLLPYRTGFTLDIPMPLETRRVTIQFWKVKEATKVCPDPADDAIKLHGVAQASPANATEKHFQISMPALHAETSYCIVVSRSLPWSATRVRMVLEAVVKSVTGLATNHYEAAALFQRITRALGSNADAEVEGTNKTIAQVINDFLWTQTPPTKLPELAALDAAMTNGGDMLENLQLYDAQLSEFADSDGELASTQKLALDVIAQIRIATPDGKTFVELAEPSNRSEYAAAVAKLEDALRRLPASCMVGATTPDCKAYAKPLVTNEKQPLSASKIRFRGDELLNGLTNAVKGLASSTQALEAALLTAADELVVVPREPVPIAALAPTYTGAAPLYISGDVGFVVPVFWNWERSRGADTALYVAISVSFVPIDKELSLRAKGNGGFAKRFSLVGGFTLTEIKSDDGSTRGVLGGKGVLAGVGVRLTDYVRVGVGAALVRQNDIGGLVPDTHLRAVPYFTISVDLDIASTVTDIFTRGSGLHL